MLPAEKTHYRKGLTLGLTLAETFSVVVFVLLLACALLLSNANESRNQAEEQLDEAEEQLGEAETELARAEERLHRGDTVRGSWYRYAQELEDSLEDAQERAERVEAALAAARSLLLDSATIGPQEVADSLLKRSAELKTTRDSLEEIESVLEAVEAERDSLVSAATEEQALREIVTSSVADRHDTLTSAEVDSVVAQAARAGSMARELKEAREAVRFRAAQLRNSERRLASSSVDSLAREVDSMASEVDSMASEVDSMASEVDSLASESERWRLRFDSLRRGIDPPPCWLDARDRPEYVFRVELTDNGMRLYAIVPAHRSQEEAVQFIEQVEEGREYAPADFLRLTRPFLDLGLRDGCRFWVRPVRKTEDAAIFEERQQQLGARFYFR